MLSCAPCTALLSTSHGVLCFSLSKSSSFFVYNLLARTSRIVKLPTHPFVFELLTLVSTSNGYRVFMLCSPSGTSNNAFVYDPRLSPWQQFDRADSILGDNYHQGVYYNKYLYFTTPEPFSIVCFDLECGKWDRLMIGLPGELMVVWLVSDGDEKLYLIGGIGLNGISRSMELWELSRGVENWAEIVSVSEMMCRKFMSACYHNYGQVYCFWHQGLIGVCCYTWPDILYYKV